MGKFKELVKYLKAFDVVVIAFYIILSVLQVIYRDRIETWLIWTLVNLFIIVIGFILAYMESNHNNEFWNAVHYWYIVPVVLITFKELYFMIKPIRIFDHDQMFIAIDRWMFGTNPTHLLSQISTPVLTEILQIVYGMFYLLPILLGLFLLRKKRYVAMDFAVFILVYGFYLSYLGYFIWPGIGPRFTLHNFDTINQDLPGLFLTNFLRELVNSGESIPAGTINPAAVVQRDIFPSGHTMITLIVMYLSVRLKSRSKYFFVPIGTLLILSTVYLWYHYVIDLIGGLLFMIFTLWSGRYIFNWWRRKVGKPEFEYGKY
ncbi:MAG: phosphatase PAP2 family protein [Ignavibacteriaceae bacterium]|jgi:membrane-associated phospholipid phosphatase|nr:phosphatase PAP2 family protein [Ignavibacteriaceae bacterium]MCW8817915.1 phosphatase PAP2 family protein [Ignavibacteriaceae bacterium]MCW8961844.1 phosphatase PAP2 family protein [Ignavibacteriaceae bacterium]MCW9094944.1 phosphatase PAP2 family protein [Ignavibacteriaceae bacterium]MCW9097658.1 phosphatase PAP2 family protein [Ignavibacteriaceae bacterium]